MGGDLVAPGVDSRLELLSVVQERTVQRVVVVHQKMKRMV